MYTEHACLRGGYFDGDLVALSAYAERGVPGRQPVVVLAVPDRVEPDVYLRSTDCDDDGRTVYVHDMVEGMPSLDASAESFWRKWRARA